jgi:hypothetical protein
VINRTRVITEGMGTTLQEPDQLFTGPDLLTEAYSSPYYIRRQEPETRFVH